MIFIQWILIDHESIRMIFKSLYFSQARNSGFRFISSRIDAYKFYIFGSIPGISGMLNHENSTHFSLQS